MPLEFHEWLDRYSQTGSGRAIVDHSPFPRMVDCWFLAVCIAFRLRLDPQEMRGRKRVKIIDDKFLASDPWRIYALMLIAVEHTGDVEDSGGPTAGHRSCKRTCDGRTTGGRRHVEKRRGGADLESVGVDARSAGWERKE